MQEKLNVLAQKLAEKQNKSYEEVKVALDKAVWTLPRLKNYFTKLEKAFKLLVNNQQVLFALVKYYLENPETPKEDLRYTFSKQYGRSVANDIILKELKNEDFKIIKATKSSKAPQEYDFTI